MKSSRLMYNLVIYVNKYLRLVLSNIDQKPEDLLDVI